MAMFAKSIHEHTSKIHGRDCDRLKTVNSWIGALYDNSSCWVSVLILPIKAYTYKALCNKNHVKIASSSGETKRVQRPDEQKTRTSAQRRSSSIAVNWLSNGKSNIAEQWRSDTQWSSSRSKFNALKRALKPIEREGVCVWYENLHLEKICGFQNCFLPSFSISVQIFILKALFDNKHVF